MKFCFTRERLIVASLLCAVTIIVSSLVFPSTSKAPFTASDVELDAASDSYSVATSFESTFNDSLKSPQALRIPSPPNGRLRPMRPMRPFRLTRPVPPTYPTPPVYPTTPYGYVSPTYPVAPMRPIPPQRPWFLY